MTSLQLFSTSGCHLCELAKPLVDELAARYSLVYEEVEIATSETLVELYGVRIPVLRHVASGGELNWPFDQTLLENFVQNLGLSP